MNAQQHMCRYLFVQKYEFLCIDSWTVNELKPGLKVNLVGGGGGGGGGE